jgi:hypothetical protein
MVQGEPMKLNRYWKAFCESYDTDPQMRWAANLAGSLVLVRIAIHLMAH